VNRIVTRGLGPKSLMATQGYAGSWVGRLREIVRLCSRIALRLGLISAAKRTEDC
jgi:hypothetical protein